MKPLNSTDMLGYNTIKIHQIVDSLLPENKYDTHLFDRTLGEQIRQQIEALLSGFNQETVHFLDFIKILSIDYTCADELIGKLISRLLANEYGKIFFVLQNLNSNHRENIQVVLDRRKVGCLERTVNNHWYFWGHRKNVLLETLNVIMENGIITARELKNKLDLELTTSSTRLSQLYKAHLVSRDQVIVNGGGREYLYRKLF